MSHFERLASDSAQSTRLPTRPAPIGARSGASPDAARADRGAVGGSVECVWSGLVGALSPVPRIL